METATNDDCVCLGSNTYLANAGTKREAVMGKYLKLSLHDPALEALPEVREWLEACEDRLEAEIGEDLLKTLKEVGYELLAKGATQRDA